MMEGKSKTNSCLSCSFLPFTNQITLRAQTRRVPRLIFRIPHIKLVMMHTLDDKKSCPCIFVYIHQSLRIKLLRIPVAQHLFVSHFRGMSVIFQMIFIRRCPLHVHFSGIPVAAFSCRLRSKMYPDSEFGIPQPFRCTRIICFNRLPRRFIRSGSYRQI